MHPCDVRMLQSLVDFDFLNERLVEGIVKFVPLVNNLHGVDFIVLPVLDEENSAIASLTKKAVWNEIKV